MKTLDPEHRRDSRVRRYVLRGVAAIGVLLVAVLGSALVLANSLDRPWIKRRIQALALSGGRVEIDYGAIRISLLSGLVMSDLVVRSPEEDRPFVQELLRVGRLDARWSPSSLFGAGPKVPELNIDHVTLTVVANENGRTSFDAILPPSTTPISQLPSVMKGLGAALGRIHLTDVAMTLVKTELKKVVERDTLRDFAIDVDVAPPSSGRVSGAIGKQDAPLTLRIERHSERAGDGSATVRTFMNGHIQPSNAKVTLDIHVVKQDFASDVTVDRLVRLDTEATFNPSAERTEVAVTGMELGDGVATVKASLTLPDKGSPDVHHASIDADLARLLRLLPPGLVPAHLQRGEVHCRIDNLALDHPGAPATVSLDGEVTDADVALTDGSIAIGAAKLSLQAHPNGTDLSVQGTISIDALRGAMGATRLHGDGFSLKVEGQRKDTGMLSGSAELRFAALGTTAPNKVNVSEGRLEVKAHDLVVDSATPLASRGDISIEGDAGSVEGRTAIAALASKPHFSAHVHLAEPGKLAVDGDLAAARFRVSQPGKGVLSDSPVRATLGLKDISADLDHPQKSQGIARFALKLGALSASVDATKRVDALDYGMTASAPQLGIALPFLPPQAATRVAWDKMGFALQSKGHVDRLTAREPTISQHTELRVTGIDAGTVVARAIVLDCESNGTATRHELKTDVRTEGLTVGDTALDDDHLTLSASLDRSKPSLHVEIGNEGVSKASLTANIAFDRTTRAVAYDVVGQLSGLAPLAPLLAKDVRLAGFTLAKSAFGLSSRGNVVGVVSDVDKNGTFHLAVDPARTAGGEGKAEFSATNLHWSAGDRSFKSPAVTLRTSLRTEGTRRTIESDLATESFDLAFGNRYVKVSGFSDHTSATLTGSVDTGTVDLSQTAAIKTIKQNFARMYPVGDVTASIRASRNSEGLVKISEMLFKNRLGGTSLAMSGGIDISGETPRISVRTNVQQDLALASTRKDTFVGRGKASMDLTVQSPDLRVYHTKALLRLENAKLDAPGSKITVDAIDGELPIVADVTFGRNGVELVRSIQVNPYTTLRFSDQHPLLSRRSFLSIGSVKTPFMSIAPFAANVTVEQNIVSLSQLEMGVRGGRITGNGIFEWKGAKSKVHADIRATGVQSSHGEPFDANAAMVLDFGDRSIEGKADIVRIGRRHLIDMLDFQDPQRADPSMNRIRTALSLGYPQKVNIAFKHGFASAGVTFGGIAQLISLSEIRGIPVGPLMERSLQAFTFEEQQ
jgi:translocation and assembly module TamB